MSEARGRPYCECNECDALGRKSGREVTLPLAAWAVAGGGDGDRLAVAPGHEFVFEGRYPVERHRGWVAVGPIPSGDDA